MLLEREEELATAAALLDMAGSGDGDVLLVEGVAGIGKTVLLGAVAEEAVRRGARVLRPVVERSSESLRLPSCGNCWSRPWRRRVRHSARNC